MQNILPLILIGIFVYLIFFRKGGMGCCGTHGSHEPKKPNDSHSHTEDLFRDDPMENVIDLQRDEYTVIPARNDQNRTRSKKC
jgi:hypothetical protein